jgi:DNA-binding transcriptional ArsR family regulator
MCNYMVVDEAEVDRMFAALADTTRRDIVTRVLRQEASISTLASQYDMSFAAVQKHVAVLERAGLVTKMRRGREQLVRGDIETIRTARELLRRYEEVWRGRLDRMHDLLTAPQGEAGS